MLGDIVAQRQQLQKFFGPTQTALAASPKAASGMLQYGADWLKNKGNFPDERSEQTAKLEAALSPANLGQVYTYAKDSQALGPGEAKVLEDLQSRAWDTAGDRTEKMRQGYAALNALDQRLALMQKYIERGQI